MPLKWSLTVVAGLLASLTGVARAADNYPFGSHPIAYAAGSILPNHVSQAVMDQAVRNFYDSWKATYLLQNCGAGRYVVQTAVSSGNLTVSEGHGYGMIIAALMAGHDPDAKAIFDGMYTYYREHESIITPRLMAWNQSQSCNSAEGADSASDGDLDIAYALLLADRQWGSCGAVDYLAAALQIIGAIKAAEVDATSQYVFLGDWVNPGSGQFFTATRSSDFMPDHYRSYQAATLDASWTTLLDHTYTIVSSIQTNHSPATGLLPDFVRDPLTTPQPATPGFLEGPNDGAYDFNACRVPWRLATDFLVSGETRAQTSVQAINAWIKSTTAGNPSLIRSGYQLNGTPSPNSDFLSMAFVAPFGVGAMVDSANQTWLNAIWDLVNATPIANEGYYENTLKLLSMIVMSGNWWAPQSVAPGSCDPGGTELCTGGGALLDVRVDLGRVGETLGKQKLKLRGEILMYDGVPGAFPPQGGAQLRIEDLGAGSATVVDLTTSSYPIPGSSAPQCDPKDQWKIRSTSVKYRNKSNAIDAPVCTAGSAAGLKKLQYKHIEPYGMSVKILFKNGSIAGPIVGPLRATLVLGPDASASTSGACGITPSLPCTVSGSKIRCE